MNLADIRKKARRERQNREREASAAEAVRSAPVASLPEPEVWCVSTPTPDTFDPVGTILAGRAAVAAAPPPPLDAAAPARDEELKEFLEFGVGDETYALDIDLVREIIRPRNLTAVPRTPHCVAGILSHRGTIIPVLDLVRRFGLERRHRSVTERIIVVRQGRGWCGLLADRVSRVVNLPVADLEPVPHLHLREGIAAEMVRGVVRWRGRMLILLELEHLLTIDRCERHLAGPDGGGES